MKSRRWTALVVASVALPATAPASETVTYTYDELGRLTSSATSGGPNEGTSVATSYDNAGNRTGYSLTESAAAPLAASASQDGLEVSESGTAEDPASPEPSFGIQPPAGIPDESEPVVEVEAPGGNAPSSGAGGDR